MEFACTYKNPEEEGDLKRILEKDEVDQVQDDFWPSKPEVFIWRIDDQVALDCGVLLGNLNCQLSYDML